MGRIVWRRIGYECVSQRAHVAGANRGEAVSRKCLEHASVVVLDQSGTMDREFGGRRSIEKSERAGTDRTVRFVLDPLGAYAPQENFVVGYTRVVGTLGHVRSEGSARDGRSFGLDPGGNLPHLVSEGRGQRSFLRHFFASFLVHGRVQVAERAVRKDFEFQFVLAGLPGDADAAARHGADSWGRQTLAFDRG